MRFWGFGVLGFKPIKGSKERNVVFGWSLQQLQANVDSLQQISEADEIEEVKSAEVPIEDIEPLELPSENLTRRSYCNELRL